MKTDGNHLTRSGNLIRWTYYEPQRGQEGPLILFLHGFKGFKDWGFVPATGEYLSRNGFRMLAFNFSHNGIGSIPDEFTELDKFRENTFSLELDEALEMIRAVKSGLIEGVTAPERLGLIGHSRGGGIALLTAAQSNGLVDATCTWAAVSRFARYPAHVIEQWEKDGYLEAQNARTGQVMQLGWGLHQDLLAHGHDRLNIQKAVSEAGMPLCIIHGSQDEAVPVDDAIQILAWAGKEKAEYHQLPANHTFGAKHPWQGSTPALRAAWSATLRFFQEHLIA